MADAGLTDPAMSPENLRTEDREARDARRLATWESRTMPLIVLAAVLPLVGVLADDPSSEVSPVVEWACWAVFAVDLVVHVSLRRRYLLSREGVFDLAIVVITLPWYLMTGNDGSAVLVVARLARLARIVAVARRGGHGVRRLTERLGQVGLYTGLTVVAAALLIQRLEGPPTFATFGDSLWWAVVTITTVGYGDLVPDTGAGRFVGIILMVGGIAVLGALAATLTAFLGLADDGSDEAPEGEGGEDADEPSGEAASVTDAASAEAPAGAPTAESPSVPGELAEIRGELAALRELIESNRSFPPET